MPLLPSESQQLCHPGIPVSIDLGTVWAPVNAQHAELALPVKAQPPCACSTLEQVLCSGHSMAEVKQASHQKGLSLTIWGIQSMEGLHALCVWR